MIRFGSVLILLCFVALFGGCDSGNPARAENEGFRIGYMGNTLTESVGIETLGGVFTPIIKKGTQIPVTIKEIFSTAEDNQAGVDIHILAGDAGLAKENRTIGRFQVYGIPPAKRGVPQIEVAYIVDRDGVLTVKAKDLGTGKENEIRVLGVPPQEQK